MNIQYLNHPPYPNRWMITLIQQGLGLRPREQRALLPFHNWMGDRLRLPLGNACSDVVSWGSENQVNQMACLTDLELDVKDSQLT